MDSNSISQISGIVVRGDGYGRTLGFPTANLDKKNETLTPGVYAGRVEVGGIFYAAGVLINPSGKIEAHLLGWSGDLYDKMIVVYVGEFIREYKKFENEQDLISQITEDLKKC